MEMKWSPSPFMDLMVEAIMKKKIRASVFEISSVILWEGVLNDWMTSNRIKY